MNDATKLILIKLGHTAIWAIFASSIVAIPIFTYLNQQAYAWYLIVFVLFEVVVLIANQMRCPLTDIASRYTEYREENFDIYLPLWLARYNKVIFGVLYVVGIFYTACVQLFQQGGA